MENATLDATATFEEATFEEAASYLDFTLGAIVTGSSLLLFGVFVRWGWGDELAPRIANRPKKVLTNAMGYHLPNWMKHPAWYPIIWIGWAYRLTYKECLRGIPGTGTRKDGSEGPLLKTNLDAIIFLRYVTLLSKVAVLVALLCSLVILPVNLTADCSIDTFGNGTCFVVDNPNRTFFWRTTIANIPDKIVSLWRTFLFVNLLVCSRPLADTCQNSYTTWLRIWI